jgi:hypothetical protein
MKTTPRVLQRIGRLTARGAGWWVVAYVAGLLLVPVADSRLEARSADQSTHVESQNAPDCPPAHDHSACQLCRSVRTAAVPAEERADPRTTILPIPFVPAGGRAAPALLGSGSLGPRAPPLV